MTFYEFVRRAQMVDDACLVFEDAGGWLCIQTNYKSVGDEDAPLAYFQPGCEGDFDENSHL